MISFFRSEYLISLSDNNCFTVCWSWVRQGVIVLLSLLILGRSFNWDREMRWDDDVVGINWMRIVGVTKKTQYLNDNVSDLLGRSISFLYLTIIALLLILGKTRRNCIVKIYLLILGRSFSSGIEWIKSIILCSRLYNILSQHVHASICMQWVVIPIVCSTHAENSYRLLFIANDILYISSLWGSRVARSLIDSPGDESCLARWID